MLVKLINRDETIAYEVGDVFKVEYEDDLFYRIPDGQVETASNLVYRMDTILIPNKNVIGGELV